MLWKLMWCFLIELSYQYGLNNSVRFFFSDLSNRLNPNQRFHYEINCAVKVNCKTKFSFGYIMQIYYWQIAYHNLMNWQQYISFSHKNWD